MHFRIINHRIGVSEEIDVNETNGSQEYYLFIITNTFLRQIFDFSQRIAMVAII